MSTLRKKPCIRTRNIYRVIQIGWVAKLRLIMQFKVLTLDTGRWTKIGPYIKIFRVKLFLKQVQDPDIALILHAFDLACLWKWVRVKVRLSDMLNLTLEWAPV